MMRNTNGVVFFIACLDVEKGLDSRQKRVSCFTIYRWGQLVSWLTHLSR